jgi:hypothetical protein
MDPRIMGTNIDLDLLNSMIFIELIDRIDKLERENSSLRNELSMLDVWKQVIDRKLRELGK